MQILNYKPINKGLMLGLFSIKVPEWGNVIIQDIGLFRKNGQEWVTFPSRSYEVENEKRYFHYMKFETREEMEKFSTKCIQALKNFTSETRQTKQVPMTIIDLDKPDTEENIPF